MQFTIQKKKPDMANYDILNLSGMHYYNKLTPVMWDMVVSNNVTCVMIEWPTPWVTTWLNSLASVSNKTTLIDRFWHEVFAEES